MVRNPLPFIYQFAFGNKRGVSADPKSEYRSILAFRVKSGRHNVRHLRIRMANEDVSRIMQSKPELRYSPAFVHIKALSGRSAMSRVRVSAALSIHDILAAPPPACVLKLYNARTPDVVSQPVPHLVLLTMCILSTRYIAICQVGAFPRVRAQFPRAIFRPDATTAAHPGFVLDRCLPRANTANKRCNVKGIHRRRSPSRRV